MAESRSPGRWPSAPRDRRLPAGRCDLTRLSNIFLHHVLDEWFEFEVRPRLKGRCTLIRFADDAVMAFEDFLDAKRVLVLLHQKFFRRRCLVIGAEQHGHRGSFLTSAAIKRRRIVAIEFGMWRSGRSGGTAGSITFG